MIEEKQINLLNYKAKLSGNGSFEIPVEELRKIYDSGIDEVTISISASSNKLSSITGINSGLFAKIREKQSLPPEAVYDFLNCKGKLSKSNFEKKLKIE